MLGLLLLGVLAWPSAASAGTHRCKPPLPYTRWYVGSVVTTNVSCGAGRSVVKHAIRSHDMAGCSDPSDQSFAGPCWTWGYQCWRFPVYDTLGNPISEGYRCVRGRRVIRWINMP
jgi:hypothetical protein